VTTTCAGGALERKSYWGNALEEPRPNGPVNLAPTPLGKNADRRKVKLPDNLPRNNGLRYRVLPVRGGEGLLKEIAHHRAPEPNIDPTEGKNNNA